MHLVGKQVGTAKSPNTAMKRKEADAYGNAARQRLKQAHIVSRDQGTDLDDDLSHARSPQSKRKDGRQQCPDGESRQDLLAPGQAGLRGSDAFSKLP